MTRGPVAGAGGRDLSPPASHLPGLHARPVPFKPLTRFVVAQVLTEEGGLVLWRQILGITPLMGFPNVHLLGTSHAVVHADTQAGLASLELVVTGYAPIALTAPAANWTLSTIADGAQAVHLPINFSFGAACTVYGYWLSDQTNTFSVIGETFANPFIYSSGGGTFTLVLQSYLVSQPFTLGPCY